MTAFVTPIICLLAVFFAYGLIQFHARRNEAILDGPPLRNDSRDPAALDRDHDDDGPLPRRLRDVRAAQGRCRRRTGAEPDRAARGPPERLPGAGDRAAVAVHVPLPVARRPRVERALPAREQHDRAPRDLARRRPLLLGVRARGQGRREPRRGQRRVRPDEGADGVPRPLCRAAAGSGTPTCSTTAGSSTPGSSRRGPRRSRASTPPSSL